jgi:hypothetical protein
MAPSSDKNDQAVQIMINCIFGGEPINAQEAMELTGRFSLAEIKQKNFANNVRARAKREYGDMCELNQALQPWDEVFPRKRSRSNSPVPPAGASLSENRSLKLKDRGAPFTEILNKNLSSLRDYYVEHLQDLVEDEDCHIEKPPESIPEPNVPSLQETLLERERQRQLRFALSLVQSSRPGDLNVLQALVNKAKAKIDEFEGADEAKDGEQGDQD